MTKICPNCGKEFETNNSIKKFCSSECKRWFYNNARFNGCEDDFVVCKECGYRGKQISQHIMKKHNMTLDEYCAKYSCSVSDLTSKSLHKSLSLHIKQACDEGRCGWQKGGENPSHSDDVRNGVKSPFSMNYRGYDGLSDDEKRIRISKLANNIAQKRDQNGNSTTSIEYYIKRGYSEDDARRMLSERQSTFTLKKCIGKYGEDKGRQIFNERQEKWQSTLNSKPIEEIERINRAKMFNGKGYSNISQKLFNEIMNVIGSEYKEVFYATNNPNSEFNEYMVIDEYHQHKYFLDFYIKDNNKVIEFDGDYWHGERRGNQERDRIREENLRNMGFVNILRIKEQDYRKNPVQVVDECVKFIRS